MPNLIIEQGINLLHLFIAHKSNSLEVCKEIREGPGFELVILSSKVFSIVFQLQLYLTSFIFIIGYSLVTMYEYY